MKISLSIILLFMIVSCRNNMQGSKKLIFKDKFTYYDKEIAQRYVVDIPVGGIIKKSRYDFTGEGRLEYRVIYPDSSVFFINNNFEKISRLNIMNMHEIGINALRKKQLLDTLQYKGVQKNGRLWKEKYLGDVVIGYSNVRVEDSLKMERICFSLKKL
jgi:hypothetical protein